MPAWVAVTPQVPAPTIVTVVPVTVQMAGVVLVYVTGRPEVLETVGSAKVALTRKPGTVGKGPKPIVCRSKNAAVTAQSALTAAVVYTVLARLPPQPLALAT
ncbi:hypothetical protein D3C71_1727650 [compost metagenome]